MTATRYIHGVIGGWQQAEDAAAETMGHTAVTISKVATPAQREGPLCKLDVVTHDVVRHQSQQRTGLTKVESLTLVIVARRVRRSSDLVLHR